ncbi:MAG: DUF1836 domain-containing protein [Oscillospiraceae bacterium]|nr:DUF1836 domain-containing protein [Bacillota bacterium]MDD6502709.1 DUF1836 domain-containing protein [Oscillospiraceae bacterium]
MPEEITELTAHLQQQSKKSLPKWEELPDIDLYMDQVIALMNRYLDNRTKDKMITPSMVNNYVKMKVMPAPVKKKYTREHLMYLIVICVLKQVMPLSSVETVLKDGLEQTEPAVFYGRFRELYGDAFRTAAEETISLTAAGASRTDAMLSLAMKAQAEQNLAEDLLEF